MRKTSPRRFGHEPRFRTFLSIDRRNSNGFLCASTQKTLHQLFLTLFLRGHSSRGLQKSTAPKSIAQKLTFILVVYALFGCLSLNFRGQPVFALAIYLHAITFVMVAMFIAASAGEILFNNQEADILLHRPVTARALLTAKVRVLVEVSLWLAAALNFIGLFVGLAAPDGGWRFPLAHVLSTTLEALFCAARSSWHIRFASAASAASGWKL